MSQESRTGTRCLCVHTAVMSETVPAAVITVNIAQSLGSMTTFTVHCTAYEHVTKKSY